MSRKPEPRKYDADIAAMSLEELKAAHEAQSSPETQAQWDRLVEARDKAQEALSTYRDRQSQVLFRYTDLLQIRSDEKK